MNEQAQRIAIAEACGFDLHVITKRGDYYRPNACGYTNSLKEAWMLPKAEAKKYEMYADRTDVPFCEKVLIEPAPLLDYLHDLNAMHEAEKVLSDERYELFVDALGNICATDPFFKVDSMRKIISSGAPHRAEAFLRTIGKWVE